MKPKRFGPITATKDPLMLDSQIFNDPSKGIEFLTPRKDLLGPGYKGTPKTSRNDMSKSLIEFEESLMLPGHPSSSRVEETPKAFNESTILNKGIEGSE